MIRIAPDRSRWLPVAPLFLALSALSVGACGGETGPEEPAPETDANAANVLERAEMNTQSVTRIEELFEGRIAGVVVHRSAGRVWIEVRGPSSFTGSNEALIVVDGVQTMPDELLALTPDDVQRIEVLKGAAAAVYGVRGANGVVLITTRRR